MVDCRSSIRPRAHTRSRCECDGASGPAAVVSACAPGAPLRGDDAAAARRPVHRLLFGAAGPPRHGAVNRARASRERRLGTPLLVGGGRRHRSAPERHEAADWERERVVGLVGDNPIPTRPTRLGLAH